MAYYKCVNKKESLKKFGFYANSIYRLHRRNLETSEVSVVNHSGQHYWIGDAEFFECFVPVQPGTQTFLYPVMPTTIKSTITGTPTGILSADSASAGQFYIKKEETVNINDISFISGHHLRMLKNDVIPIPLSHKKVEPAPEFDSKCHLCGQPCNKRGKVSVCEGGCQ